VAWLAGLPDSVVGQAKEVMARWEHGSRALRGEQGGGGESERKDVGDRDLWAEEPKEERTVRVVRDVGEGLLLPADDDVVWSVVRELYRLDIANMTPVQALVTLNDWQGRLKVPSVLSAPGD
jgi:DNA mismatch repair ATPase MutS